ncbi:endonuclease domain-containing protein [Sansalvadorimonas sp. 2012CJ34-2]|uniref:Endonuclease domain-containing protein n=1 Tax=Parendozoicomonas callyspongiae TaxID=2942213 RepID=A0ABT0PIU7_9GAMM|nr:endonuclease domain-containing protein [Sansalvadorimonas sp. 2012CJ34-2]MCL6270403.1 endonuclease domain-containing protein [Sansalvadorimonas sp. 2012CJ34-2]
MEPRIGLARHTNGSSSFSGMGNSSTPGRKNRARRRYQRGQYSSITAKRASDRQVGSEYSKDGTQHSVHRSLPERKSVRHSFSSPHHGRGATERKTPVSEAIQREESHTRELLGEAIILRECHKKTFSAGSDESVSVAKDKVKDFTPPSSSESESETDSGFSSAPSSDVETDFSKSSYSVPSSTFVHGKRCDRKKKTPTVAGTKSLSQNYSRLWGLSDEDFLSTIKGFNVKQLGLLGECFPDDRKDDVSAEKIQAFCRVVVEDVLKKKSDVNERWLYQIIQPMKRSRFYNDDLSIHIGKAIRSILDTKSERKIDTLYLMRILECIAQSSTYVECMPDIISCYLKSGFRVTPKNLTGVLKNIRSVMMLHAHMVAFGKHAYRIEIELKQLIAIIETYIQEQKPALDTINGSMLHWIRLYGNHVLGMKHLSTDFDGVPPSPDSSSLHKEVQRKLKAHLPETRFIREKRLGNTEIFVDLFCEPNVVIEVDGKQYHHMDFLPLRGSIPPRYGMYSRQDGKTWMKKVLMRSAGYEVINITSSRDSVIEGAVGKIEPLLPKQKAVTLARPKPLLGTACSKDSKSKDFPTFKPSFPAGAVKVVSL